MGSKIAVTLAVVITVIASAFAAPAEHSALKKKYLKKLLESMPDDHSGSSKRYLKLVCILRESSLQ